MRPLALALAGCLLAGVTVDSRAARAANAAPPPAPTQIKVDPRLLDDMAKDVQHFAEMVAEYRGTARQILKRAYQVKIKEINAKYDQQIDLDDREARERRRDAIAMFEAFLLKYPNDKRWTPDAMFRLAELYYEKSAEEYLDADEAYKKAIDSPNPPTTPPPRVDYTPTINLYRRLLTEFPNYRFLDATYYLLGFCLGEMGEDAQAKQALLALVCANKYKPLDPPAPPPPPLKITSKGSTTGGAAGDDEAYKSCTPVRKDSKFLPEAWTRVGEFHFDQPNELKLAIAAFRKVLTFKDSPYYDRALYKLAWSYYRDNRFPEAVREFDNLVQVRRRADGGRAEGRLRPPPRGGAVPRASASPSPTGTATRSPIRSRACSARSTSTRAARARSTCARSSSAWATSTSTRRSTPTRSPSTRRCSPSGRTTSTRPRCRTGSSTPTRRTGTWWRPPRSARRSAATTPRGATGTSTTARTPTRSRPRRSWPRTRC